MKPYRSKELPSADGVRVTNHRIDGDDLTIGVRWWESLADMCAEADRQEWLVNHHYPATPETIAEYRRTLEAGEAPAAVRTKTAKLLGQLETAMSACDLQGVSAKRRRVFSDSGDEVDTDRFLENRPDCWREVRRGKRARLIRIGVNCLMSWGNHDTSYETLAATACAVSDTLTRLGYAVEVVGMLAGEPCRRSLEDGRRITHYAACVHLKRANAPLDLELIGTIGHSHFHHWMNRGARLLDVRVDHSINSWSARVEPAAIREAVGLDYLFTRSWFGCSEVELFEGITAILGEENASAAA